MPRLRPFVPALALLFAGAACLIGFSAVGSAGYGGAGEAPGYLVGLGVGCLVLGALLLTVASIRAFVPRVSPLELGRS